MGTRKAAGGLGQPSQTHKDSGRDQVDGAAAGVKPGEKKDQGHEDHAGNIAVWVQLA